LQSQGARERGSAGTVQTGDANDEKRPEIDTEHIFGFTEGSDVGEAGEKELEVEPLGRFGKRVGSYAATSTEVSLKYTPVDKPRPKERD
jgi:hypothetical protein